MSQNKCLKNYSYYCDLRYDTKEEFNMDSSAEWSAYPALAA